MLTLDEIRDKLKDRKMTTVSEATGIHLNAIYRFMNGSANPKYETVQKIVAYLEENSI